MAAISCTHCGADLTAPQSVRIAEYQADNFTILCNSCKRLVRTLPISK